MIPLISSLLNTLTLVVIGNPDSVSHFPPLLCFNLRQLDTALCFFIYWKSSLRMILMTGFVSTSRSRDCCRSSVHTHLGASGSLTLLLWNSALFLACRWEGALWEGAPGGEGPGALLSQVVCASFSSLNICRPTRCARHGLVTERFPAPSSLSWWKHRGLSPWGSSRACD